MTSTPAAAKDRITCHILDTVLGKPARGVHVKLELVPGSNGSGTSPVSATGGGEGTNPSRTTSSSSTTTTTKTATAIATHHHGHATTATKVFESQTDDDGRVRAWLPYSEPTSSGEVPVYTLEDVLGDVAGASTWTLRFDTEGYFGPGKTFFPEVAVTFRVEPGQHYHVPLLLNPYSYTTYRGS